MKRYLLKFQLIAILALLIIGQQGFGQSGKKSSSFKADPRLYDCFEKSYVDGLSANPRLLLYYNFYLDHSYIIADEAKGKPSEGLDIMKVALRNPGPSGETLYFNEDPAGIKTGTFNPLKYAFETQADAYTHYVLGTTGKVLIFLPHKDFAVKYREYLRSFNLDTEK